MPPCKDVPTLEESMAQLAENLAKLQMQFNQDRTELAGTISAAITTALNNRPSTSDNPFALNEPNFTPPTPPHKLSIKPPKIHLPTFDGSNPLDWLFQAEQYFRFYEIVPAHRLTLASFYLKGEALSWYKYLFNNRLLTSWDGFTRSLELRFGPSSYENHQATLFKLQQTSTVTAYQTEFERLSNCVIGLSQEASLNCFISGLRKDIRQELAVHKPQTLNQAIGLAKLIEDKLADYRSLPVAPHLSPPTTTPLLPTPPLKSAAPSNSSLAAPLPVKRLNPDEMQRRKAQGLCFRCPEKFHPGHRCNPPQFLMIEYPEQPTPHQNTTLTEPTVDQTHNPDMGAAMTEEQYVRHFRSH